MSQRNNEKATNPHWDYYITWHSAEHAKALIDKALVIMSFEAFPNAELYEKARDYIREAEGYLRGTFRPY